MSFTDHASMTSDRARRSSAQIVLIAVSVLLLGAAAVGMPTSFIRIHQSWSSKYGHFAHGYFTLAFSVWIGVRAWRQREALTLKPHWVFLPVLLLLVGLLVVCLQRDILTGIQSLLPAILFTAFAMALGWRAGRLFVWAVVCLYFAMPVWYLVLNEPLRAVTTTVSVVVVNLSGIPVIVRGNEFELSRGIIEIAQGCSGLNYLISALSLAYLFAMLYLRSWSSRLKLLAAAAIGALLVNWIRVVSLILIGHFTDMRHYFIRVDHLYYGWVLFLAVLWPIFWLGAWLERRETMSAPPQRPVAGPVPELRAETMSVAIAAAIAALCLFIPLLSSRAAIQP